MERIRLPTISYIRGIGASDVVTREWIVHIFVVIPYHGKPDDKSCLEGVCFQLVSISLSFIFFTWLNTHAGLATVVNKIVQLHIVQSAPSFHSLSSNHASYPYQPPTIATSPTSVHASPAKH